MATVVRFETARLVARLLEPEDVGAVAAFQRANETHFASTSPIRAPEFLTEAYWRSHVEHDREDAVAGRRVRVFLFPRDEPATIVGQISLNNIARGAAHYCDLGYAVAADREGQGLMTEAVAAAIRYAFDDLRLHRVKAAYLPANERSGKLLRRLGFVVEGYARDYLLIRGRWRDMILVGLVNPDWRAGE